MKKNLAEKGNSIIYVVKDKEILGIIGVNDVIREESKEVIEQLSKMKIENNYANRRQQRNCRKNSKRNRNNKSNI